MASIQSVLIEKTKWFREFPIHTYSGFSGPWLENRFFQFFTENNLNHSNIYLPIFWTDIWVFLYYEQKTNPANTRILSKQLYQKLTEVFDLIKEHSEILFYTIVQHDHGKFVFSNIFPDLPFPSNLITFSQTGVGEITLPLLKDDSLLSLIPIPFKERKHRVSFCGRIDDSNDYLKIRSDLHRILQIEMKENYYHYYGSEWVEVMKDSVFSLCPRGNANTSFRLYEAIMLETIPVYIYSGEKPILPFENIVPWNLLAISINSDKLIQLPELILSIKDAEINERLLMIRFYKKIFSYEFICPYIFYHFVNRVSILG